MVVTVLLTFISHFSTFTIQQEAILFSHWCIKAVYSF